MWPYLLLPHKLESRSVDVSIAASPIKDWILRSWCVCDTVFLEGLEMLNLYLLLPPITQARDRESFCESLFKQTRDLEQGVSVERVHLSLQMRRILQIGFFHSTIVIGCCDQRCHTV